MVIRPFAAPLSFAWTTKVRSWRDQSAARLGAGGLPSKPVQRTEPVSVRCKSCSQARARVLVAGRSPRVSPVRWGPFIYPCALRDLFAAMTPRRCGPRGVVLRPMDRMGFGRWWRVLLPAISRFPCATREGLPKRRSAVLMRRFLLVCARRSLAQPWAMVGLMAGPRGSRPVNVSAGIATIIASRSTISPILPRR